MNRGGEAGESTIDSRGDVKSQPAHAGAKPNRLRCPRCGYDVHTSTLAWQEACPLEGLCSECGLTFRWGEVFEPTLRLPHWCVEFSSRRRVPWAVIATALRSAFLPWCFWRRMRLSMPIHAGRLALHVAALAIVPALVVLVLGQAFFAVLGWLNVTQAMRTQPWVSFQQAGPLVPGDADWPAQIAGLAWQYGVTAVTIPTSRPGTPEANSIYGFIEFHIQPGDLPVVAIEQFERMARAVQNAEPTAEPTVDTGASMFVLRMIALPLSDQPAAVITDTMGVDHPFASPQELVAWALAHARRMDRTLIETPGSDQSPQFGGALMVRWLDALGTAEISGGLRRVVTVAAVVLPPGVCMAWIQLLLGAAVFVLLPQTRRRSRVRWAHVGRVTAYGTWIVALPASVPIALGYLSAGGVIGFLTGGGVGIGMFPESVMSLLRGVGWGSVLAVPLLFWIWWACAAKFYLRVPHAWAVGLAQSAIAAGVTIAIYQPTVIAMLVSDWWLLLP